jgi:hypothetical protein
LRGERVNPEDTVKTKLLWPLLAGCLVAPALTFGAAPTQAVVECEEDVYAFESANNGAGPLWCSGSTCLVRVGNGAFASGLETLRDAKPLNNCRWRLFRRGSDGWQPIATDDAGRTREPSPLAAFSDGRLFLSANPTLVTNREAYSGPARPEVLQFSAANPGALRQRLLPVWDGAPAFTEHSYRSFAADGVGRELVLFQIIGYTHAEWAFYDRDERWSARGQLNWPWGAEYDQPQPIRICYPNVALRGRAVHFCGVSDIVEPYAKWRAYKKELTGREWDYDFRRLFYTWTPDVTREKFRDWIEIASRDKTCGWVSPGDLWLAPNGAAHLLWTERALDERLREKFFPGEKQSHSLRYAVVREGKVMLRRVLAEAVEGGTQEVPGRGRFQVTPAQRLFVVYYVSGRTASGQTVSENRVIELRAGGEVSAPVRLPLKQPLTDFFTATVRGGSPPSRSVEMLGHRAGSPNVVSYARVRLD